MADFRFASLLGAPYRGGNLLIHGNELLTPVGNRVSQARWDTPSSARPPASHTAPAAPLCSPFALSQIDLTQSTASTLPFENGRQIRVLAVSPDGRLLVSVDEAGRALIAARRRRALLHHFSFKDVVRAAAFSPDGQYLAVAVGRLVQVRRRWPLGPPARGAGALPLLPPPPPPPSPSPPCPACCRLTVRPPNTHTLSPLPQNT